MTKEMLMQSAALAGLTDEQYNAIAEMSKNDENTVIGARIGALHGQYDNDIFGITNVKKRDGEKSYDYAKRVITDYKTKAETAKELQGKLTASEQKVADLEAKIASGVADEELRKQLNDTRNQVTQLQGKLQAEEAKYKAEHDRFEKELLDTHVDYAFKAATSGIKFKDGITEPIQKTLLNAAKAEVLAKGSPDFVDDGKGGRTLVLRGADGNILNNPKNNLNPYTMQELVMETSLKDVISQGRNVSGGGTGGNGGSGGGGGGVIDLSTAKTQIEADKAIETYLLTNGLTRDSAEFAEQSLKIRNENNVSALPLR